ncbi:MAG: nucleoside diphosphate kinase regulator [Pseudomonadota bacterium]
MATKPDITLSRLDLVRLEKLIDKLPPRQVTLLDDLLEELARGRVVAPEEITPDTVTMNSRVSYRRRKEDQLHTLTLCYPGETDAHEDGVSVLAPIGSALIGLRERQCIDWTLPDGSDTTLTIEQILSQPEREGRYTV